MTAAPDVAALPSIIRAVRDEYGARGHTPYDIGNGLCEDFACSVLDRWVGEDWILRESEDGFQTVETLNFIDQELDDWDWPLLAGHWRTTPPDGVPIEVLTRVAQCQPTHIWITVGGRHYDVDVPDGVDTFLELPFFRRWTATMMERHAA